MRCSHVLSGEAHAGLVRDLRLPVAPFADMTGDLPRSEAVLRVRLARLCDPSAV